MTRQLPLFDNAGREAPGEVGKAEGCTNPPLQVRPLGPVAQIILGRTDQEAARLPCLDRSVPEIQAVKGGCDGTR